MIFKSQARLICHKNTNWLFIQMDYQPVDFGTPMRYSSLRSGFGK